MLMSVIWIAMVALAMVFGALTGSADAVSSAVTGGAGAAVELMISIGGAICLWSAVMEVMEQSGLTDKLSRLLRPLLKRLYPLSFTDSECSNAISSNFAANLLGLGSAATPAGIRAVKGMTERFGERASAELGRLVVMNTASVQLIPATVAAVRAGLDAAAPFDILPCVWISSVCSVSAGLLASWLLEGKKR